MGFRFGSETEYFEENWKFEGKVLMGFKTTCLNHFCTKTLWKKDIHGKPYISECLLKNYKITCVYFGHKVEVYSSVSCLLLTNSVTAHQQSKYHDHWSYMVMSSNASFNFNTE